MGFRAMTFETLKQIRKPEAFKRFKAGKPIMIAGNNQNPIGMMPGYILGEDSIEEWKLDADRYGPNGILPNSDLWEGDRDKTAWCFMIRNFLHYLDRELGYYPVYYVDSEWEKTEAA